MSYNALYGIISGNVSDGDVSQAIGLVSGDVMTLCSSENINPMAKYKPVRYNKKEDLTEQERASVRYGMDINIPHFNANNPDPDVTWNYFLPRPDNANDWGRITDFSGYYAFACVPFAFNVHGALKDGVGIEVCKDGMAGTYYQDIEGSNLHFEPDLNLAIEDLFSGVVLGGTAYADCYFGIIIFDMTKGDNVAIVFNKKFKNMSSVEALRISPTTVTDQSLGTLPAVSMLDDSTRSGNTFRFIACLFMNGPANPTTYAYEIEPNNMDVYSLAIRKGIDRKDIMLYSTHTIAGLQCTLVSATITATYNGTVTKYGITMADYTISGTVVGSITTPSSGHWSPESTVAEITLRNEFGYVGDNYTVLVETALNISTPNTTYTKTVATISNVHVYYPPEVPQSSREIQISGCIRSLYERIMFDNKLNPSLT